jgi:hypothetical protein
MTIEQIKQELKLSFSCVETVRKGTRRNMYNEWSIDVYSYTPSSVTTEDSIYSENGYTISQLKSLLTEKQEEQRIEQELKQDPYGRLYFETIFFQEVHPSETLLEYGEDIFGKYFEGIFDAYLEIENTDARPALKRARAMKLLEQHNKDLAEDAIVYDEDFWREHLTKERSSKLLRKHGSEVFGKYLLEVLARYEKALDLFWKPRAQEIRNLLEEYLG